MLSISGTARLADGSSRSFAVGSGATGIVITINSDRGPVGSLIFQFDERGNPYIRLKKQNEIDIRVSGFTQFRLSEFLESGNQAVAR